MPASTRVPVPLFVIEPEPVMALLNVMVPVRRTSNALLSVMGPVPSTPVAPPLPTCKVPPLMAVPPL